MVGDADLRDTFQREMLVVGQESIGELISQAMACPDFFDWDGCNGAL